MTSIYAQQISGATALPWFVDFGQQIPIFAWCRTVCLCLSLGCMVTKLPYRSIAGWMVGLIEFESTTSSMSTRRSNQLSYRPFRFQMGQFTQLGRRIKALRKCVFGLLGRSEPRAGKFRMTGVIRGPAGTMAGRCRSVCTWPGNLRVSSAIKCGVFLSNRRDRGSKPNQNL